MTWYPGWDSLDSVRTWHTVFEISGIAILALLVGAEILAFQYGQRKDELTAIAESSAETKRKSDADAAEARRKADVGVLQERLSAADKKVTDLEKQQAPRRLTDQQKQTLTAALSPHKGQKVVVLTILGNAECKRFMEDFLAVFDAAGWDYGRGDRVIYGNFGNTADPIGVTVLVNTVLGDQKKGPVALLPLMETFAAFGLVPPMTVTRSNDVRPEEVGLVIGRKT